MGTIPRVEEGCGALLFPLLLAVVVGFDHSGGQGQGGEGEEDGQ
jgi:hypothetical protein